jgi:hypothetical protein
MITDTYPLYGTHADTTALDARVAERLVARRINRYAWNTVDLAWIPPSFEDEG